MEAKEITEKVGQRKQDFNPLFKRMDIDFEIWKMVESSYDTEIDTKTKAHETDIKIISNKPRTSCDNVQSILSSAERQIIIRMAEAEGDDKREDIGKLERLFEFLFERADERLILTRQLPLRESLIWFSLVRGWMAGRFLTYKYKGKLISKYSALDPRWLTYEIGENGFLWVNYETRRSKVALEDEYGDIVPKQPWYKPWGGSTKNIAVYDYWKVEKNGKISNAVVCGDTFLKEPEPQKFTSMPILIMPVSTRPTVVGSGGKSEEEGYGDSIFASIRGINGIRNRFASIIASHANLMANQALLNYKDDVGVSISSTTNVPGGVIELVKGHQEIVASPMKEISPTVTSMYDWLSGQVEDGTLPDVRVASPAQSGTLQNIVQEAGNKIFNPQIRLLNHFYSAACRLIEEQIIADKITVTVKSDQDRKYREDKIQPVDLKRAHIVKVEFTASSPWQKMDAYQVAEMAMRLEVPLEYIYEFILKFPDPKAVKDLAIIELFEHSPKPAMKTAVKALMKSGRIDEAEDLIRDLEGMLAEERAQVPQGVPQEAPPQAPIM